MNEIALVRRQDLLIGKIINVIEESVPGTTVTNYGDKDYKRLSEQKDLYLHNANFCVVAFRQSSY